MGPVESAPMNRGRRRRMAHAIGQPRYTARRFTGYKVQLITHGAQTRRQMANSWAKPSMITLDRYLRTGQRIDPTLIVALEQVALAVKRISNELAGAALKAELGYSGAINVQGEEVDTWSDNVFSDIFSGGGPVCTLISEEMEDGGAATFQGAVRARLLCGAV